MITKNIAIICNYVLNSNRVGGMDRFYKLLDTELKSKRCQVDWYFSDLETFDFYQGLTLFSAKGNSVEQYFIKQSIGSSNKYDVIITHFTELCTKYYKSFKKLNPKSQIIAVDHNPRPLKGFPLKKKLKKRVEGVLYSRYIDCFIGVSKYTVNHILNDYGRFLSKKTTLVYNGIDINIFKKRKDDNKNRFIIASHLRKSKGIQDLLYALDMMSKDLLSEVEIDVYGTGPYEVDLKQLSNDLSLDNVVHFKGSSPHLNQLFSSYSYMIQPTYMECFSLSILESLSANVPVITTTVGGNLEILKDGVNSYIYNPGDVNKLSFILESIVKGEKTISKDVSVLIKNNFYLEKMVKEHIKLISCI